MVCSALLCLLQVDPAALVPLYKQALATREQQWGPKHPKVARSASDLGLYLLKLGDRQQAIVALRRALDIDLANLPATDPVVAADRENLASALPPSREVQTLLAQAGTCSDPHIAARALTKLADLQTPPAAIATYRKALALEETAARLNDLALLLNPESAEPLLRKALTMRERDSGAKHPETAIAMNNLGNALLAQGKLVEAEQLLRGALSILEETLGKNDPRVTMGHSNLADVLRAKKVKAGVK
jgi:tetratricopeptide (TPR) repeat protein